MPVIVLIALSAATVAVVVALLITRSLRRRRNAAAEAIALERRPALTDEVYTSISKGEHRSPRDGAA